MKSPIHDAVGYIYQFISNNVISLPSSNQWSRNWFVKVKLYHHKFDYLIDKEEDDNKLTLTLRKKIEYYIGQKIN